MSSSFRANMQKLNQRDETLCIGSLHAHRTTSQKSFIPASLYQAGRLINRRYPSWFRRRVHLHLHRSLAVLIYGLLLLYYHIHLGAAMLALSQSTALRNPRARTFTLPAYPGASAPSLLKLLAAAVDDFDRHGAVALQRHGDPWLLLQNKWVWIPFASAWPRAVR
ncbi:hypothetical protein ASPACDRAFT_45880 [Aspergillus aculeatus ATCC 16872]|uniref:Uncharacterized protein n=1 Tax=Aspergillus aculeatus (strain ATCC 16872 / CBS 172.66 / WB 5094) TaxID=690307 RepID=A0A1L9WNQ8_ASPA1|nr:uncharacterized protein ASPACDRAFT_45880 [Aspergillus aculeatus ATCC 16872]OJJ97777.1 hypothetical protein ASPACDRAFT_45880 [Aspergillus aculeatus ATCC 16872]